MLGRLIEGQDLDQDLARLALDVVLAGEATDAQIAGFIIGLRQKGETVTEIVGLVDAMLASCAPLDLPPGTVDIVGMGGSAPRRIAALNVSTMASIVAAAAGAVVCKHGNRKASSTSGSFDLLEQLGVGVELDGPAVRKCVDEAGVGFAFARTYHPAMRFAGPVRAELGVPTVFNVLGPLSHPGRVRRQVLGVADHRLIDTIAGVVAARGAEHTWVVSGGDGLDELTTTTTSTVRVVRDGAIETRTLDPTAHGLARVDAEAIAGGDAAANAAIARRLFEGETGPVRDIVALNAGAALVVADVVPELGDGIAAAITALEDGKAAATLARLVEVSANDPAGL